MDQTRVSELERRLDGLVGKTAREQIYGKALYRQFEQHCRDDETRHGENVGRLAGIEAQLATLNERLLPMVPMMRRIRANQVWRKSLVKCLSRWRRLVVAGGVTAGAAFIWFDGHWSRIVAVWRAIWGS